MPVSKKPTSEDWSYETTIGQIEAIVEQLEQGELPLAEVFDQFEQAVQHLRTCEAFLKNRQAQATLLLETLNDA
ncbi:MAG: exodeoxyribonuclease VII small subunit [Cyanobacteria bacterium P01_H01_bin.58]